jgi:hypothetical protein
MYGRQQIVKRADLLAIGPKANVIQIVPPKHVYRPAVIREADAGDHELVTRPLASPTGPGGAAGFRNRGGSQIVNPNVVNVYLGPFWGDRNFAEGFSKAIVENGYLDPLRELGYGTGSGTYSGAVDGPTLAAGKTFSDTDARNTLRNMLDAGQIHGDANSLFVFILPDGVVSVLSGERSCQSFCGYHEAIPYNGTDIAYAVLPSPLCSGCGGEMADFTAVYAHELAEACTDKVPGKGWVADDGSENGDLEAWIFFPWGPPDDPNRYNVQGYYTNERGNTIGAWRTVISVDGTRPPIPSAVCQAIVVNRTPFKDRFKGDPDQLLKDLGIFGDNEVQVHRAGIVQDVEALGFSIDPGDIDSGPAVSVADCRDSVHDNAQ